MYQSLHSNPWEMNGPCWLFQPTHAGRTPLSKHMQKHVTTATKLCNHSNNICNRGNKTCNHGNKTCNYGNKTRNHGNKICNRGNKIHNPSNKICNHRDKYVTTATKYITKATKNVTTATTRAGVARVHSDIFAHQPLGKVLCLTPGEWWRSSWPWWCHDSAYASATAKKWLETGRDATPRRTHHNFGINLLRQLQVLELGFGGESVGLEPVHKLSIISGTREVVLRSMNVCIYQTGHQKLAAVKVEVAYNGQSCK